VFERQKQMQAAVRQVLLIIVYRSSKDEHSTP
jgi:hypothetical protein